MLLTFYFQQMVSLLLHEWLLELICSLSSCLITCQISLSLDKTIKLWKISERDKRAEGYNLKDEDGRLREPFRITGLRVCSLIPPILPPFLRLAFSDLDLDVCVSCCRYQYSCQWISW